MAYANILHSAIIDSVMTAWVLKLSWLSISMYDIYICIHHANADKKLNLMIMNDME